MVKVNLMILKLNWHLPDRAFVLRIIMKSYRTTTKMNIFK